MPEGQDQDQDKTQDPTPKRRQEARDEGNVAKSQDLSAAVSLMGALVALWMFGAGLWESLINVARISIVETTPEAAGDVGQIAPLGRTVLTELAGGLWPVLATITFFAIAGTLLQVGLLWSTKKLEPKLDTINPIAGFKKLFFSAKTYVGFGMNLLKLVAVALVAAWSVYSQLPVVIGIQRLDPAGVAPAAAWSFMLVAFKVAAALLVIALLDFAWQRFNHEKQLKMTHQQVKDEMKKMEGDPEIKKRRRQIQMQQAISRISGEVPKADVVVTNPTHFAVAIRYDEEEMRAPRVVARGADLLAARIRELATRHGVPIVERPPLARALYGAVAPGQEIPEDFYAAVAELLAYVYRLDRELAGAA